MPLLHFSGMPEPRANDVRRVPVLDQIVLAGTSHILEEFRPRRQSRPKKDPLESGIKTFPPVLPNDIKLAFRTFLKTATEFALQYREQRNQPAFATFVARRLRGRNEQPLFLPVDAIPR